MNIKRTRFFSIPLLILLALAVIPSSTVFARESMITYKQSMRPAAPVNNDTDCLKCHSNQAMSKIVGINKQETFSLYVNPDVYQTTVHKEVGLGCIGCHVGFKPENGHGYQFNSLREATLKMNDACGRCHGDRSEEVMDSVHAKALSAGNVDAAVCSDCHSPHNIVRIKDPVTGQNSPESHFKIAQTCERCHSAIYEKYTQSVHGEASIKEHNPDVPTCTDCHGVHSIDDPRSAAFRLRSPQICAKCHTDVNKMAKYGISTNVMNTYVSDFHGTTITIFEKVSPDAASNKPVCYDCHGIHDIARTDDPQKGLKIKQNLLVTCQRCHPDATTNFPDSWTSHYIPDANKYPIVYYINLFYAFLIPGVLGGMGLLVLLDFGRAQLDRFEKVNRTTKKKKIISKPKTTEEAEDGKDE